MAEAARVLDYEKYNYGSAAPAREHVPGTTPGVVEAPQSEAQVRQSARARVAVAMQPQAQPGVSLFAILGTVVVAVLMFLVILAQISYAQIAAENARLGAQLSALNEQHRRLEITFESVMDMNEVERYARDVLGMSRPSAGQTVIISGVGMDRAEVLAPPQQGALREFGSFISSLLEILR
ncbi:MAG: cell division protein FtsL [Oscillospiraceae bacterium]|nr:cell division protein FtsL [Oscillospiraceae bacterium]